MQLLKTFGILVLVVAIFGGAMFALNFLTGPIIEANKAGAANDRLNAVMPGGSAYEDITATLSDLPANVVKVSRETTGLGYVIECTATSQYTGGAPMDIVLGVDAAGKICGINLVSHSESLIFAADYPSTYIGADSALAGVELYAGSTYSSTAFKNAVEGAMGVLTANDLIAAGVKTDEQVLAEMIPTLHTGLSSGGMLKAEKSVGSGNIFEGYKALNGSGFAFIMQKGDAKLLALVNNAGACKIVDVTGADVTADNAALCEEALAAAGAQKDFAADAATMIKGVFADAAQITPVAFNTFGNVVYAATFQTGANTYFAFFSKPLTYEDTPMSICTILDENGAIVKQNVREMAFGHGVEYMPGIKDYVNSAAQNYKDYLAKFDGLTGETLSDSVLISGATLSSTAVKLATADVFAPFNSINNGGDQ
jgi:hypothetical protein